MLPVPLPSKLRLLPPRLESLTSSVEAMRPPTFTSAPLPKMIPFGLIKYTWPLASKCPRISLPLLLEMRLTATADADGCRKSTVACEPMLKLSQSIATSALDCLMSVVLPTWVMLALPDTTFPPSGWLVALKLVGPHTGVAQGEAAGAACISGGAACPSGASASEIAAATKLRLAFDRVCPDLPRPLAVSATGTQALRTSLQMSR